MHRVDAKIYCKHTHCAFWIEHIAPHCRFHAGVGIAAAADIVYTCWQQDLCSLRLVACHLHPGVLRVYNPRTQHLRNLGHPNTVTNR